jgi:hypothetical protein
MSFNEYKDLPVSKPESLSALMIQICLTGLGDDLAMMYYRKRKRDGHGMNLARLFEN